MQRPVFGIVMSHAVGFGARWDLIDEARRSTLAGGIAEARSLVAAFAPDLVIAYVNDHFQSFSLKNMPAFCIGLADRHEAPSADTAVFLRIPARTISGEADAAMQLLEQLMQAGFDPAYSAELALFDDLSVPLFHLFGAEIPLPPVVPILTNCVAPPLPSFRRCYEIGQAVGNALATIEGRYQRIMVLGTGGLSHWVGTPKTGRINQEFDRDVIAMVTSGRSDEMRAWKDVDIEAIAGNGALELKNWIAALATVGPHSARSLAYAPVREWLTGTSLVAVNARGTG
jgi:hypothetical protein